MTSVCAAAKISVSRTGEWAPGSQASRCLTSPTNARLRRMLPMLCGAHCLPAGPGMWSSLRASAIARKPLVPAVYSRKMRSTTPMVAGLAVIRPTASMVRPYPTRLDRGRPRLILARLPRWMRSMMEDRSYSAKVPRSMKQEPSDGGAGVELLGARGEADVGLVELFNGVEDVDEAARPPVEAGDEDDVEPAGGRVVEEPQQLGRPSMSLALARSSYSATTVPARVELGGSCPGAVAARSRLNGWLPSSVEARL